MFSHNWKQEGKKKKRENDSCQTSRFTEWSIQIHRPYTSGPQNMPRVNRNKLRERYIIAHLLTKQTKNTLWAGYLKFSVL